MKKRGDAVRRAVSMYPEDWETVECEARRDDSSVSAALRRIVREWKRDRIGLVVGAVESTEMDGLAERIWKLVERRAKEVAE